MIKCCIFDLDGTLLNTLEALTYVTNLTMAEFGYGPIDGEHIRKFVGNGYKKQVERSLLYCGDEKLEHYEEGILSYMKHFEKNSTYHVRPYKGILELLEELKKRKIKLAVLSNKPHAQTVENIESVFGKGYFDYVAGEREGIPRKPDPTGVKLILDEWGVKPEETMYFGDTNTDMETGLGAGAQTVGVTWGFRDRQELEAFHPQYIVDNPNEVLAYF